MKNYLFILFLIPPFFIWSQTCIYDYTINKKKEDDHFMNNYKTIYNYANNRLSNNTETYYIPVVFHVVYNTDAQNIPDSVLISQIEVLNEDYRRLNANASETRDEFLEFAGDPNIEFFLANVDPNGNPTNGITRTQTMLDNFIMDSLGQPFAMTLGVSPHAHTIYGGIDPWPVENYMNIWVCDLSYNGEVLMGGFSF